MGGGLQMDYSAFVAERIANLRQFAGVSARDMSLSVGQNVNYINHIENRKTEPSMSAFFFICEYFRITPKEFFDDGVENPQLLKALNEDLVKLDTQALESIASVVKEILRDK